MVTQALAGLEVDPRRCVMVGDRLGTDIELAVRAGMSSALVLTGDSTLDDVLATPEAHRPTYILERIDRLIPSWDELGWTADEETR